MLTVQSQRAVLWCAQLNDRHRVACRVTRCAQGRAESGVCRLGGAGQKAHALGTLGEASSTTDLGDVGDATQARELRHLVPSIQRQKAAT